MTDNGAQELRDANGNIVGYFVSPGEYTELRRQNASFRERIMATLPVATEEQEEEFRQQLATGTWLDGEKVIAELISELSGTNGRA